MVIEFGAEGWRGTDTVRVRVTSGFERLKVSDERESEIDSGGGGVSEGGGIGLDIGPSLGSHPSALY